MAEPPKGRVKEPASSPLPPVDRGWRIELDHELNDILKALARSAEQHQVELQRADSEHRDDALNLVHYVALRQRDVRELQRRLGDRGLSSLGRCEPYVAATLHAVIEAIGATTRPRGCAGSGFSAGRKALDRNTDSLLGPRPKGRVPRIMVTLPTEAADDPSMAYDLARRGMDVARINGAHDGPDQWAAMAGHVTHAAERLGRPIPISFDLPGPKLRTGPILPGPRIMRIRPDRDARGVPLAPARFTLGSGARPADGTYIPVSGADLPTCAPGDEIELQDTRGSKRRLRVLRSEPGQAEVEVWDTTYLEAGMVLAFPERTATIGDLAPTEQYHVLRPGDTLKVTGDERPVPPWRPGTEGEATIGSTLEAAVGAVRPGHRVTFDDGRLSGVVETSDSDGGQDGGGFTVRILSARPNGSHLKSDRGINLPDSDLPVPMLAEPDYAVLRSASVHGSIVGLSFVRHETDLDSVMEYLGELGASHLGLILKIETVPAFQRLPEILLRSMRWKRVGVMIARGDLAVEASYERLAEVQEEILWLAEAARLPVVWATEVLDRLARTGRPTRAEITDAAMAQRAECVMLNKGPFIDEAITALDDILKRMAGHQRKKTALLRQLRSWAPD